MIDNIYVDLAKYSKKLMLKEPFYGLFLITLNKVITEAIPTACVSKNQINMQLSVNPVFWEKQDELTKIAILKHEMLHIAFQHLTMLDSYNDRELLNVAADLEINQYIADEYKGATWDGLEIHKSPYVELKMPERAGTREYYKLLQKEIQDNPDGDVASFLNALKEGLQSVGHDLWKQFEDLPEAERKLIEKQIDHQLKEIAEQVTRSRGTVPSELKSYIDGLYEEHVAVIDWKAYLRRFNGMANKTYTKKTRRKPNRRFGSGPALKIKQKKNTLVAIDTSGSVSNQDLLEFFEEIHHIHKTGTYVTIVECDAMIQRHYEYKGKREETISVKGRGGTDFEPVMQFFLEQGKKFNNLIYLTDGECCAPQTKLNVPILWVICSGHRINEALPGAQVQIQR
jgi:predicted metal-dependent peptidase